MGAPQEEKMNEAHESEHVQASTSQDLFNCLHTLMNQFEEAEGAIDPLVRDKLNDLYVECTRVPEPPSGEMNEAMIQTQLEDLKERMTSLEARISELSQDPEAEHILGATSELWMPVITASVDERRRNAS